MPFDPLLALALPREALVNRRVPKKLLVEKGAFAARDRRRVHRGIEELRWLAALKPTTVGITAYRDRDREYLEIAVLKLQLRPATRSKRLVKLVHRAVPYPVLLIASWQESLELSLAHKRRSLAESERTVIDGEIVAAQVCDDCPRNLKEAFRQALALGSQPDRTLMDLYQGWIATVNAFLAATITGVFSLSSTTAAAADREAALHEYREVSERIAGLSSAAHKERQIPLRAELNMEIARLRTIQDAARARL